MPPRIVGYDVAKCMAIVLVVLIHFAYYVPFIADTSINNFIIILFNISVPLFFMVNGALLFSKPLDISRHYRKTLHIVVLTLIWKTISALIMGAIVHISPFRNGKVAFLQYLLFGNLDGIMLGHFWFLNALIMLYLIYPLLKVCFDNETGRQCLRAIWIMAAIFTVGTNACDTLLQVMSYFFGTAQLSLASSLSQINPFGAYGYTLLYFIGGGVLHDTARIKWTMGNRKLDHPKFLLLSFFIVGWIILFAIQRFQNISSGVVFNVEAGYWNIATVVMTFSAFLLFKDMRFRHSSPRSLFKLIGDNTLGIYLLHMFFLMALAGPVSSCNIKLPLIIDLGIVVLICAICLMLSLLCKKIPIVKILFKL